MNDTLAIKFNRDTKKDGLIVIAEAGDFLADRKMGKQTVQDHA